MLKLIYKYKSVLRFLVIFIGSYLIFVTLYNLFLTYGSSKTYYPDIITHTVANQSQSVINALGYAMEVVPSKREAAMNLNYNDTTLARVVEGCNSVSILLLFIAFMLAFFGETKRTLLYIFSGAVLIYAINILRIALLTIALYKYPEYTELLHGTIFPAVIYGTVFFLWVGWIQSYRKPEKNEK
ncbi:exosortase family protein XrtF [Dokdonia sp. Hel_I_53]|uniref:exosortase family protein XrtF n=1 Tax=Dokdonia sp. Hel_I_53 TaxID=1566287 RepID=UPI00119B6757|nr:exosortase family protein XrtF [Dokdonia sp. Hel_I_53]TVZ52165.1 exosortase family protein XrtF [Dokdonia sp. Hel_I_53]